MKTKTIITVLFLSLFALAAHAQEAKIVRLIGAESVTVYPADSDTALSLTQGDVIPVGALVEVPADAKLFMKTFEGTITTALGGSTFLVEAVEVTANGKEKTMVELKSGDLVATLDPEKRDVNDYGIRTPKGVAAARGTNYTVSFNNSSLSKEGEKEQVVMMVTQGSVVFDSGGLKVDLSAGSIHYTGSPGSTFTFATMHSALGASGSSGLASVIQAASNAVAQIMANPVAYGMSVEQSTAALNTIINMAAATGDADLLAGTVGAAAQGNPAMASTLVTTATAANPDAAGKIFATTLAAVEGRAGAPSASDIRDAANAGIEESNGNSNNTAPLGDSIDEEPVGIEVPTDNVPVSPSS